MNDQVAQNQRRTFVLMAAFVVVTAAIIAAVLFLFGLGLIGVAVAGVIAGGLAYAAYRTSDAVVLRMSRAVPADPISHARMHNLVDGLCIASGLPNPRLYVIDDEAPNAFATGRSDKQASLAVTTGLLELMNRVELEAVLAHELSHIKNRDILVSTVAVTTVGLLTLVADVFVRLKWWNGGRLGHDDREEGRAPYLGFVGLGILVLSPVLSRLLHLPVSRQRESLADVSAAEMTRYPPGMISALEKLRDADTVVAASARATAHLWIEASVAREESEGELSKWNAMFDTHPPIEERIEALREL